MGNIPIVYQNKSGDASKKCMEMKKFYARGFGLKIGWILG